MFNAQFPGRSKVMVRMTRTGSSTHTTRPLSRFNRSSSRVNGSKVAPVGMRSAGKFHSLTLGPKIKRTSTSGRSKPPDSVC